MRQEKRKKRGGEKVKTAVSLLNPQNFAFCACALPELAAKRTTCKQLCGSFLAFYSQTMTRKPLD